MISVSTEAELMQIVSPHRHIIEYLGDCYVQTENSRIFYILTELCTEPLSEIIASRKPNPWSEDEVLNIFLQVTSLHPNSL
jgi:hypothetical protein